MATGSVPVTPVVSGKPVALVKVADAGVPRAGVTSVGDVDRTTFPEPVEVVTPVPPLATAKVPASVMVPAEVMGPPDVVKPVVPPETATEVTVPLTVEAKVPPLKLSPVPTVTLLKPPEPFPERMDDPDVAGA